MAHDYKLIVNDEEMTIGPVHKVERTDEDYTFLDEDGSIVAMLKKERLQGMLRLPAKKKERETIKKDAPRPPLSDPTKKQLKEPVNDGVPPGVIMPDHDKWQGRSYQYKQNHETKGYEIHSVPRGAKESDNHCKTITDEQSEQLVELRYKGITTHGVYDPISKKVVIEKGSLISRKETHTLQVAVNRDGVNLSVLGTRASRTAAFMSRVPRKSSVGRGFLATGKKLTPSKLRSTVTG